MKNSSFPRLIGIFLISPIISMIFALRYKDVPWAKNIFWLYCIFFGYTMVIPSDQVDANRYVQWMLELSSADMGFWDFVTQLVKFEQYSDFVQPLLTYLVAKVSTDSRVLYAVFSIFFGFFYSRNIWIILRDVGVEKTVIGWGLFVTFFLTVPIWNVNAFRFNTAMHVFLFGVLNVFVYRKSYKGVFFMFFSALIHFSLIAPLLIFLFYRLFGDRIQLFFLLYLVTSVISTVDLSFISGLRPNLPAAISQKLISYSSADWIAQRESLTMRLNWYVYYYNDFVKLVVFLLFSSAFYWQRKLTEESGNLKSVFSFSLLFYSMVNLMVYLPEGSRFLMLANLVAFFFFIYFVSKCGTAMTFNLVKVPVIVILIITNVVMLRRGMDFIGVASVFGNLVTFGFMLEGDFPIIDFFK
ncbi:EpsG family protein [uncultured Imperialibacter sp.]|uniref:EpsG family protein n=1 Tax=uncultured Imperialibacter sp. TaxID=1672639 RepID=UPI0030DC0B20